MGVAKLIATMVPRTPQNVLKKFASDMGTISSIVLMSLEKRLTILPRGVVSKNDIGECMTFTRML